MDGVSVVMSHCHRAEVLYNMAEVNGKAYTSFAGSVGVSFEWGVDLLGWLSSFGRCDAFGVGVCSCQVG